MAEVVNLRLVRKRKARDEKEAQAAENRASFGQSKSDKQKRKAEQDKLTRDLDGHKREP